ncbi:MAG: hypothetical protein KF729_25925 [Sandaracinaceae bacterium]|nr:hypothetical protein [Sandaracinaceae bacterium]
MRRLFPLCAALLATLAAPARAAPVAPINAVVGDASWLARYGRLPTEADARERDELRHEVHLAWIERHLRAAPVDHLAPKVRARRARLLDALAEYRARGVHPVNERRERLPRFLDREGRICAVGYLIEVSASRALVEAINERHEYDYLLEIEDPALDAWIAKSGFTARELASIQPTGYTGPSLRVDAGDGDAWLAALGAGIVLAADVALFVADVSLRARGRAPGALPVTQVVFGGLELAGAVATLAYAARLGQGDAWRDPLLGTSIVAGLFGLVHVVLGATTLGAAADPPPARLAFAPAPGGGMLWLDGRL